ncbi:MAG: amylo-alpha-1,6-glucosidase [Candidatus Goldiibacteriota bacterium]
MISFGRHICNDFRIASEKEWIITNENGSYASSTILMTNTRKHHGMLVAKFPGIDNRIVLFPNCDEEIETAGNIYHISTHKYKKTVFPKGYALLENFSLKDDVVTFLYLIDNIRLKKDISMMKDSNTTIVTYTVLTPESKIKLRVRPLIAFREADHLVKEMPIFDPDVEKISDEKIKVHAYMNLPPAYIYNPQKGNLKMEGMWYRDFFYIKEDQSGFDAVEDLYNIGTIEFSLEYNSPHSLVFSTEDLENVDVNAFKTRYNSQIWKVHQICQETGACVADEDYRMSVQQLISAAESFVVRDSEKKPYVVAGYPWPHYIWFRDTFASLPGLFLVLQKYEEAREILVNAVDFERNGLLPLNMTMDKNEIKYDSVDTTLWFFYALNSYLKYTGDYAVVGKDTAFLEKIEWIMHKHITGADYGIHKDTDGLLYAGISGTQLTWMDTKVNGQPVTPRQGKPVEINALWYNAVRTMQMINEKNNMKEKAMEYKELGDLIYENFNREFWNEEGGYLYDYIDSGYYDDAVRSNQVFAISLPYPLIEDSEKKTKIMNTIIKELYTSFGLRTLSNMNVNFKTKYDGNQASRDRAAHQGTVWAWSVGHFVTAYLKTYGRGKDSLDFIETVYEPLFEHLKTAGLSTVSEMFDGNFPYTARGRVSHAWAVAEILRSYMEDFIKGPNA